MLRLWAYSWKSPDGTRHEDSIKAPSREDAFSVLRQQGIRPIKVTQIIRPIDRVVIYSRRFGILIIVAAIVALISFRAGKKTESIIQAESQLSRATPLPRQQIDLSKIKVEDWFKYKSEIYLTKFASPGILSPATDKLPEDIVLALKEPLSISTSDPDTVKVLKRVVAGIKSEISQLHEAGKNTDQITEWLLIRQQMEFDFRKQLIAGREKDKNAKEQINSKLRSLGLKEIE